MIKIKHLIKPRQFGKTYDCITESAKTGAIIVVKDTDTAKYIKKVAKEQGLSIPNPLSAKQIINNSKGGDLDLRGAHFIIDDADSILYQLLGCHPIDIISMVSRDHDGYEEMSGSTKALMGLTRSRDTDICPDDRTHFGFARGTKVTMADGTYKNIEDIVVGDMVLGIPRDIEEFNDPHGDGDHPYHCLDNYIPSMVLATHMHNIETISVWYKYGGERGELFRVSPKHKFLTCGGVYMSLQYIIDMNESYIHIYDSDKARRGLVSTQMSYYELELNPGKIETVYHLSTETGTYIAGNGVVL